MASVDLLWQSKTLRSGRAKRWAVIQAETVVVDYDRIGNQLLARTAEVVRDALVKQLDSYSDTHPAAPATIAKREALVEGRGSARAKSRYVSKRTKSGEIRKGGIEDTPPRAGETGLLRFSGRLQRMHVSKNPEGWGINFPGNRLQDADWPAAQLARVLEMVREALDVRAAYSSPEVQSAIADEMHHGIYVLRGKVAANRAAVLRQVLRIGRTIAGAIAA